MSSQYVFKTGKIALGRGRFFFFFFFFVLQHSHWDIGSSSHTLKKVEAISQAIFREKEITPKNENSNALEKAFPTKPSLQQTTLSIEGVHADLLAVSALAAREAWKSLADIFCISNRPNPTRTR